MQFAKRLQAIQPSATLEAARLARLLKEKGVRVIDFTLGEPDFATPKVICEAAKEAIDQGYTHYAPVPGIAELRKVIAEKLKKENGLAYSPKEILVSCGAKQAIYLSLQAILNDGDEVILPAPYWTSFPEQVKTVGGTPVIVETSEANGFKIHPDEFEKAINPKIQCFILNSPSNPTGMGYNEKEMQALGEVAEKKNFWILSDEIYEKLTYDGFRHVSFATACPRLKERTITVNGVSKTYAMTGWRMGYTAAPKELIEKMKILQSQQITSIATFIQRACITAFKKGGEEIRRRREIFAKRREKILGLIDQIPGVSVLKPQGGFFLFPNVKRLLHRRCNGEVLRTTLEISKSLLNHAHVATVPGEGFGAPGYLRISYACSFEDIEEGMKKFAEWCGGLE